MPTAPKRGVKPRVNAAKQCVGIMAPLQSPNASLPASAPTDILFHDLSLHSRPASQSSRMAPTSSTVPKRGISPERDSHTSVKEPAKKKHRGGKLSKGKIEELALKKKEFLQYLEEKGNEWGVSSAFLLCNMNLSESLQTSKTTIAWNKFQHNFAQDCEGDYSAMKASAMFNELHDEHGGEGSED
ncbi:uncharacterized protein EI90DRAFT_3130499 [Cantharellus anzutake]|uniref:uncharacterized protein n=1 Tax=Cantharellus anzutake TaxID=1750568 RepID=UPI001904945B|nr:uncharacterized protein EI90DRAFT_3130499 [Cantharellus anzutake]KAF8322983.1 hypothetical protein EI90DRAFT_3130499 [Cantharellus anzutake]